MGFNFAYYGYLFLIPVFFVYIIWMSKNLNLSAYKKRFVVFIRCLIILLIIFSLSGLQIRKLVNKTTTIFAVDLSDSNKESLDTVNNFIKRAIDLKGNKDEVGIVSFGTDSVIELSPNLEPYFNNFDSIVEGNRTNISQGIKLASTLISEESKKRIVLISDGQENIENALNEAKIVKSNHIPIDVLPIKNSISEEVQLTEFNIPNTLNKNQEFTAQVKIDSLIDTNGLLKIYNGQELIETKEVKIRKGQNRFAFSDIAKEGGGRIYRAEIDPQIDTITQNNIAYQYSYVEDIPHILLIEKDNSGLEIKNILENSKLVVDVVEPHTAPAKMEAITQYDGMILANISADDLDEKFLNNLDNYIKHIGGGLLVSGGESSFALGNYFDTPLETMLPVNMKLKDKNDIPDLGLMIVTDRSGSMAQGQYGLSKLELAKEAAIRSTEVLNPFDKIGVLAFDDIPEEIVTIQGIENHLEDIQKRISSISVGGGTSIIPALKKASENLENEDTKLKHIILLTDGQAEHEGYDEIVSKMRKNGITLSTVAVGNSSDTDLLKSLAKNGGGRYYYTDEFSDIPKIFMKETMMAGKTYINNNSFYPEVNQLSPLLQDVEQLPMLRGYIRTTAKSRGQVILSSAEDDPILAIWRYGLGKSAVWTSDFHNQWTLDWLSSDEGVAVVRNTVAWILRKPLSGNISVKSSAIGKNIKITAEMPNVDMESEVRVTIVSPNSTEETILLKQDEPHQYTGEFLGSGLGAYILNFQIDQKDGGQELMHTGINIPYSPEYDIQNIASEPILLNQIAKLTGGRVLKEPKEVFEESDGTVYKDKDVSEILLILTLLLFVLDIGLRRIAYIGNKIEEWSNKIVEGLKRRASTIKDNKNVGCHNNRKAKRIKSSKTQLNTSAALLNNKKKRVRR